MTGLLNFIKRNARGRRNAGNYLPATTTRVEENTSPAVNQRVAEATERHVRNAAIDRSAINRRLNDLDREWDIERVLEANAATVALTGAVLALTVHRRFAWVPVMVGGFLLQHALQGWCPPVPLFRRLGVRTAREIELERDALRILRGDFSPTPDVQQALGQASLR